MKLTYIWGSDDVIEKRRGKLLGGSSKETFNFLSSEVLFLVYLM